MLHFTAVTIYNLQHVDTGLLIAAKLNLREWYISFSHAFGL